MASTVLSIPHKFESYASVSSYIINLIHRNFCIFNSEYFIYYGIVISNCMIVSIASPPSLLFLSLKMLCLSFLGWRRRIGDQNPAWRNIWRSFKILRRALINIMGCVCNYRLRYLWFALDAWLHYFMLDVVNLNIEFADAFFVCTSLLFERKYELKIFNILRKEEWELRSPDKSTK